jgi:hypothetical protein
MKRIVLLLTILAVFSVISLSPAEASTAAINGKAPSIASWFSYYLAMIFGTNSGDTVGIELIDDAGGQGPLLGGDADDYANGKVPDPNSNTKTIYEFDGSGSNGTDTVLERE